MTVDYRKHITRHDLTHHRDTIFVFGDNDVRSGLGGQAREMRGEPNAVGVRVKKSPSMDSSSFYTDDEYQDNIRKITEDLRQLKIVSHNKNIIFPEDGIGTGLALLYSTAPKTFEFLTLMLDQNFGIKNGDITIKNKIRETLYKEPTNKFKPKFGPGDLKRGDGIVFSKMGNLLKGDIVDIQNDGTPREIFKVALHDESTSVIKTRHLNTTSTGAVIDILYKGTPHEECVVRLLDGTIKNIRTNWIKYRKHQGPIKIGDEVGFDNKNITIMIVLTIRGALACH